MGNVCKYCTFWLEKVKLGRKQQRDRDLDPIVRNTKLTVASKTLEKEMEKRSFDENKLVFE